mgnify:FL=1
MLTGKLSTQLLWRDLNNCMQLIQSCLVIPMTHLQIEISEPDGLYAMILYNDKCVFIRLQLELIFIPPGKGMQVKVYSDNV